MGVLKNLELNGDIFTPPKYYAGQNVQISPTRVISATDTTYTAGNGITIDGNNVISADAFNPDYEAGTYGDGNFVLNIGSRFNIDTSTPSTTFAVEDGTLITEGYSYSIKNGDTVSFTITPTSYGTRRTDFLAVEAITVGGNTTLSLVVLTGDETDPLILPTYTSGSIRNGDSPVQIPLLALDVREDGVNGSTPVTTTADYFIWDDISNESLYSYVSSFHMKGWVNITNSTPQTFLHATAFRGILLAIGNTTATRGMWIINSSSNSTSAASDVLAASAITVTPTFGSIAVTSNVTTTCHLFMICLEGTGDWT